MESWKNFADGWARDLGPNFWAFAQTMASMFGGAMTLGAGWWAWSGAQSEIKAQIELHDQQRLRDLAAARASLPLALSQIVGVANACLDMILEQDVDLKSPATKTRLENASKLDPAVMQVLRDCIRSADDASAAWLAKIVQIFQISLARTLGATEPILLVTETGRAKLALDWTMLQCLSERCFAFSRGEVQALPARFEPETLVLSPMSRHWGTPKAKALATQIETWRAKMGDGTPSDWLP